MDNEKDMELQDQNVIDNNDSKETDVNKDDPQYRGKILMQQALEHLEKGEIEKFETDRALANKYFDEMNAEEEELDALYNESRNFGIIYQVIESNVNHLLESAEGQKSVRRIVKAIKGDKILHEQFKAYNNLQPSNSVNNVSEYITEALSLVPSLDKKLVKETNEKLIRLIRKEKLDEMVDIDDDKLNLFESIEYVTMNKKSIDNIDEYINATNIIKESICKLPSKKKELDTIKDYTDTINSVSESLGNDMTHDEVKLLKEIYSENGENYFNECKSITLSKLNEMMSKETDMDTKSRLSQIYEKINAKYFNKKNAAVDVSEMIEIQNTIDE